MAIDIRSWGRVHACHTTLTPHVWRNHALHLPEKGTTLPYGLGRSYGDSCLNSGGGMIETRFLNKFISFDTTEGVLTCEAGASLDEILRLIVPQGWFLPTTPGTKFVTLGGAIANDIHGKNHHVAGTIGNNILSLELLRSDGTRRHCDRHENEAWFRATIGGLGLTGLITSATLKLRKIESSFIDTYTHKFRNLGEFFAISNQCDPTFEHTVSWIDCLSTGDSLGRGIYMGGNHSAGREQEENFPLHRGPKLPIPVDAPNCALNTASVKAFNLMYYQKQRRKIAEERTHYESFFYPLDVLKGWNRIYGKRGFFQYQSVVPLSDGEEVTKEMLKIIANSGQASFLAVLKKFGDMPAEGMLSFPRPGVTLALDFPNNGLKTERLFLMLDEIVKEAQGVLYPAKDGRMPGADFLQYFPEIEQFKPFIDPRFTSDFWERVTK